MAYRLRGVGMVQDPATGILSWPWYCGAFGPLGFFAADCGGPTAAQLRLQTDMQNLGPAALANPELVASLKEQWQQSYAQQAASHPVEAAAAEAPITSAAEAGVQPFVNLATSAGQVLTTGTSLLGNPWILGAGLVLVLVFMMAAVGGGSPRRYGR